MKKLFYLFLVMILLQGCQRESLVVDGKNLNSENNLGISNKASNENNKPDVHTQIVLGEKLENPYSVINMQNAFNYYNDNVSHSPFKDKRIRATHYYIMITPHTEQDLEALDKLDNESAIDTPVLSDHPLDYEVKLEGDYYINPTDENDLYHPTFTTIPVGYILPNNMKYEILDELYEPKEDEYDVETVSLFFANWHDDLEADNINVTDATLPQYLNDQLTYSYSNNSSNQFYPTGKVTIQNTGTNNAEGLMKAEISYGRAFWWHYTYTDNNGNFIGNAKKYRGNVSIRAKWRGNTATIRKTWNEVLGMFVSDYLMTLNKNNNGATKYINYTSFSGQGNHLWSKGTVNNGLRKYVDYCNTNGITNTISNANVWAWEGNQEYGATPMLYKYQQLPVMSTLANVGQVNFWHVLVNVLAGATINLVPAHLRPDQIYSGLNPRSYEAISDSRRIHQLIFHESGHYSHASKVGASYWAQFFSSEISNSLIGSGFDPYKDGTLPSIQAGSRIALCEGWATLTEFEITNAYYSQSLLKTQTGLSWYNSANGISIFEGFNVYDKPMNYPRTDNQSWFLHGIMWDLLDSARSTETSVHRDGNGILINNVIDNVYIGVIGNTYNLGPLFNLLNSNVHNSSDLKNAAVNTFGSQSNEINTLFHSYGY